MGDHVHIRRGVTEDAERLKEIGVTGWETTYAGFVEPENRRRYLNGAFWSVEQLRSVIAEEASIVLVAESDERTIGFITVEPHDEGEYELTRLYVDPRRAQRRNWTAPLGRSARRPPRSKRVGRAGERLWRQLGRTAFLRAAGVHARPGDHHRRRTQTVYDVWYRLEM